MIEGLFQPTHLILLIIFIVFGAGKLPKMGSALGRGIGEFRRAANAPMEPQAPKAERTVDQPRAETDQAIRSDAKDIS